MYFFLVVPVFLFYFFLSLFCIGPPQTTWMVRGRKLCCGWPPCLTLTDVKRFVKKRGRRSECGKKEEKINWKKRAMKSPHQWRKERRHPFEWGGWSSSPSPRFLLLLRFPYIIKTIVTYHRPIELDTLPPPQSLGSSLNRCCWIPSDIWLEKGKEEKSSIQRSLFPSMEDLSITLVLRNSFFFYYYFLLQKKETNYTLPLSSTFTVHLH